MSGTADAGDGDGDGRQDGDHAYFRAIEEVFIRLRGAPLLLSPEDWRVASRWHRDGVPLALVEATLEEVFRKRRERGKKGRINSLRYCAPAVEAAWAELREIQGPGRGEAPLEVPVAERLAALAGALPAGLAARATWEQRILGLSGAAADVEERLRALDGELLEAAADALGETARRRIDDAVDEAVSRLRGTHPDDELEALRRQLWRRRLREELDLPFLTLF